MEMFAKRENLYLYLHFVLANVRTHHVFPYIFQLFVILIAHCFKNMDLDIVEADATNLFKYGSL